MDTYRALLIVAALALGLAACGDDSGDDGGGASGSGASGAGTSSGTGASSGTAGGGTGGSTTSSGQGGQGTGGSVEAIPFCVTACGTTADCDLGSAPYDADNYSCDQGGCVYEGCNSTGECQALGDQICHDFGSGVPFCLVACNTPQDCDFGGGPAYDADNYSCDQGACIYRGCNSDSECQSLGAYLCRDVGGIDVCMLSCLTPSDCDYGAGPAYDADNYDCEDDVCQYVGCNSDVECQSQGNFVCR